MRIIDTFPAIRKAFPDGIFDLSAWRQYAGSISPELAALCETDAAGYDFSADVAPVLSACLAQPEQAEAIHQAFLQVTQNLPEKFQRTFGAAPNASVILYLGLCNGAGWATKLGDAPAVLLGLEKILELGWGDARNLIALIYHELGHIWHFETRGGVPKLTSPKEKALWQLYAEGIAMYTEQLLCDDMDFYHQNVDGWLSWCRAHRSLLLQEYRRRIQTEESVQDFFGDWCSFMGHSDCGYFLGGELIHHLSRQYSLPQLAQLDLDTIAQDLNTL